MSFETLEHLTEHRQLLKEFKRILRADGLLVISTPDKDIYSGSEQHNQFHVKELNKDEFTTLVEQHFEHVVYFGQQFETNSVLTPLESTTPATENVLYVEKGQEQTPQHKSTLPTYLIAVASDTKATIEPFLSAGACYFNDINNSLFDHYEQQVANLIATDKRLIEADKRLHTMELQLKQQSAVINQLQARLGL